MNVEATATNVINSVHYKFIYRYCYV